ncbi:MAG: hypothetical protein ACYDDP_07885 [Acidithiobacillus sp.]
MRCPATGWCRLGAGYSQILATLREPQEKRVIWTMMSTAEAICSRMDGGEW